MSLSLAVTYLVGSWLIGYLTGLLLSVLFKGYVEWFR